MKRIIIPSIIATSQKEVDKRVNKVKKAAKILQLDIMDGEFVPTHSLDFEYATPRGLRYEAHLMIKDPEEWIEDNHRNAFMIIFQVEAVNDIGKVIRLIKSKKKKVGLALNPKTSVRKIKPYLKRIDQVLIMTVEPGYYGAKFVPSTLKKVTEIRKLAPKLNIEVDGSMNSRTIRAAAGAGANKFISGSYLQKSKNVKKAIDTLYKKLGE